MSFNILDAAKIYLNPTLIDKASFFLHEANGDVSKALSGIVPIVLSGFVTKTNSDSYEANEILVVIKNTYAEGVIRGLEDLIIKRPRLLNKGLRLVQSLFEDKFDKLVSSVASFADIKESSVISLFSLAGLLLGSLLGKFVIDLNMNSSGLSSFLHGQKINIMSMLPARLSGTTNLLGLSEIGDTFIINVKQAGRYANETMDKPKYGMKWLVWLSFIVIVSLALWFFAVKNEHKKENEAANNNIKLKK